MKFAEQICDVLLNENETEDFVSGFYSNQYSEKLSAKQLKTWRTSSNARDLISVLSSLKAPKRCFVEIACLCAEHVLPVFEKSHPNDKRPRQAIEAARNYISNGSGTAARAATARAAAGAAAWAAAWAAASDAALAALAAAWDAAGAAEQEWQKERLLEMMKGIVSH